MRFLTRQQQLQHLTVGRYRLTHACMGDMARVGVEAGATWRVWGQCEGCGGRCSMRGVGPGHWKGVRLVLRGQSRCGGRCSVKGP